MMKHCVLMIIYKDVNLVNRIINTLPSEWGVYVHIDAKSSIEQNDIENRAITIKKRKVFWGSFEHVMAYLDLMKLSVGKYDYYHLITGQDYLCIDPKEIDNILREGMIWIENYLLPKANWIDYHGGYDIFRNFSIARWCDVHTFGLGKIINKIFAEIQKIKPRKLWYPNNDIVLVGGTIYSSLPNAAVEYILTSNLTEYMIKKLRFSLCGEEVFLQTILYNSVFRKDMICDNKRYIDWDAVPTPKILDISDHEKIIKKRAIFCRKISSDKSEKLLDALDLNRTYKMDVIDF